MNERERLTFEAARRLLRSRFRQHLLRKSQEVEKRHGKDECYDLALDSETAIEAASDAAWRSTLRLWEKIDEDSPSRKPLEALIRMALASTIELTQSRIHTCAVEYEYENVKGWVLEFIEGFTPGSLIGVKPCSSGT